MLQEVGFVRGQPQVILRRKEVESLQKTKDLKPMYNSILPHLKTARAAAEVEAESLYASSSTRTSRIASSAF